VRINAWETMDPADAAAAGIQVVRATAMDIDGVGLCRLNQVDP
jgi:hypothetical protein